MYTEGQGHWEILSCTKHTNVTRHDVEVCGELPFPQKKGFGDRLFVARNVDRTKIAWVSVSVSCNIFSSKYIDFREKILPTRDAPWFKRSSFRDSKGMYECRSTTCCIMVLVSSMTVI